MIWYFTNREICILMESQTPAQLACTPANLASFLAFQTNHNTTDGKASHIYFSIFLNLKPPHCAVSTKRSILSPFTYYLFVLAECFTLLYQEFEMQGCQNLFDLHFAGDTRIESFWVYYLLILQATFYYLCSFSSELFLVLCKRPMNWEYARTMDVINSSWYASISTIFSFYFYLLLNFSCALISREYLYFYKSVMRSKKLHLLRTSFSSVALV